MRLRESLSQAKGKVLELEESNTNLNTKRDEVVVQSLSTQEELAYYKSDNFKKNIIDYLKSSYEYILKMINDASSYLDKGCVQIICQLHHHFVDMSILLKAFEANFDNETCRRGTNFVT